MIPLKDDIKSQARPVVTITIIALNVLIFLYQYISTNPELFIKTYGTVPYEIIYNIDLAPLSQFPVHFNLIFSMFIHGGFMHILGNMLFLWVFGDNIEDSFGKLKFILFYIVAGLAGSFLHILLDTTSKIPAVGASGAISGVLGAYLILYPKARVLTLIPIFFFIRIMYLPAFLFLGLWFLYQLFFGISYGGAGGGVAFFAHIGGFIAGVLFGLAHRRHRRRSEIWHWF